MGATSSTKLTLAHRSGKHGAFPGCPRNLTADSPPDGELAATGVAAHIRRESSGSACNMKVICYDLMLAYLWSARPANPGFLIHDSTIFDGVDERPRAEALELAASESWKHEFLHIFTVNSDYVPRNEFSSDFRNNDYIRRRLTDAHAARCLMGVRF